MRNYNSKFLFLSSIRKCIWVFPVLILLACGTTESTVSVVPEKILLFEISGNGLQQPSYVFGTLHFVPEERFFLPEVLTTALDTSEVLVLEANIDIPLKEQIAIVQRMMLPNGETLEEYLPDEVYQESIAYMTDSMGMSEKKAQQLMHLKPVFLMAALVEANYNHIESYEKTFMKTAKKNEQDILFLEDIYFQLDLLDSLAMDDQVKDFSVSKIVHEYEEMLEVYLEQDLDKLEELVENTPEFKEYEEMLMVVRNKRWIPKMHEIMQARPAFFAVGAAHLFGERGVLQMLEKEGYIVNQMGL